MRAVPLLATVEQQRAHCEDQMERVSRTSAADLADIAARVGAQKAVEVGQEKAAGLVRDDARSMGFRTHSDPGHD